jgi:hypothetical protein
MTLMRVSKDPADPAFDPHHEHRRVWCKDQEVLSWFTADEFRRSVVLQGGQVLNGGVLIERLPQDAPPAPTAPPVESPVDAGFAGAGLVYVSDRPTPAPSAAPVEPEATKAVETVQPEPAIVQEPQSIHQTYLPLEFAHAEDGDARPEVPDPVVVDTPSERLPDEASPE